MNQTVFILGGLDDRVYIPFGLKTFVFLEIYVVLVLLAVFKCVIDQTGRKRTAWLIGIVFFPFGWLAYFVASQRQKTVESATREGRSGSDE
jgi:hypothetical protein